MKNKKYCLEKINEDEIRLALYMQDLFDIFFSNKGLQHLIDKTRELLDRPLIIYDSSYKILSMSFDAKKAFQFTKSENGSLYMNQKSISFIRSNHITKEDIRNETTFQGILCTPVKIDKIEIAMIAVYEADCQFQDIDFMLMNQVGALYSMHLQRSILLNPGSNQLPGSVLVDLIEGKLDNSVLDNNRLYLSWARTAYIYIIVIAFNQREAFDGRIPVAFQRLKSFVPVEQCIFYKPGIVIFIDDILFTELFGNPGNTFYKFLEDNNLSVGVSRKFSLLAESKKQYDNAVSALEIGRKKNIYCSFFEDCTLNIIAELISGRFDLMDFCHPGVIILLDNDRKNGTQLLQTLKQYIFYSSAPAEAARILNIHKNTLFYRISKIKDMTGIKLEHGDEICKVYLSIRLLETNGVIS